MPRCVDIPRDELKVPAERLAALLQALMRAVELRAGVCDCDSLPDIVHAAVVVGAVKSLEPVLGGPLLANPRERAQAVLPVDHGATAEVGPGLDGHLPVDR